MQGTGEKGSLSRFAICALAALVVFGLLAQSAAAAAPTLKGVGAFSVTETSAGLRAEIDPEGKATTYRFEFGAEDCATSTCIVVGQGSVPSGSAKVKEAFVEGLIPLTLYHFRVVIKHSGEAEVSSGDRVFVTRSAEFSGLPDGRVYEQASPVDKDGGDLMGDVPTVKAAESGGGITFDSTFGIPGGKGAQEFPTYLASRGTSNWSTQGLLPPPSAGERAQVIGWSPDYTEVFSQVSRLEATKVNALIVQSTSGGEPTQITPYVTKAEYFYAGQSKDGSVVLFESRSKLTPEAIEGVTNLYAWDRNTKQLHLAGIYNDETSPARGTLAGPYEWTQGITAQSLRIGGSFRGFYLRDEHAVSTDGSVYFTEVGTGQLYERINPTQEQSAFTTNGKGEEECSDPAKACTVHVSFSQKTNGKSPNGTDPAGSQPAAFQASSADGKEVFFTSPEKLTNNANTGIEQPPAQIEQDDLEGGTIETPEFISPQKAIGVAVDAGHVYWVDPTLGTIGRADLDGNPASRKPTFIDPGTTKCEIQGSNPPAFEDVPSTPRYVAVDSAHVYWTNTGCSDELGPLDGTGTIGRANIEGPTPTEIEPEFITGASNPQGIAVNSEHIYWANAGRSNGARAIAQAPIGGEGEGEVKQKFFGTGNFVAYGVALSPTHIYFSSNEETNNGGEVSRIPLEGGTEEFLFVGQAGVRGVAVDASHVYWAMQASGEEAIGRADLNLENPNKEFIPLEGKPNGVAVNTEHLFWANNGEAPTNPGNDLYRYGPGKGQLEDLTPDGTGNGAEVQGVLGASADGKYVYFAANGVLDEAEEAEPGDCKGPVYSGSGNCSLYLWHEGAISLVARLSPGGGASADALNWAATPRELFGNSSYVPKTSFISADGQSLLFRSQEKLTAYDNEGVPEYYRFKVGQGISCVSCNPGGEAASEGPRIGRIAFPGLGPLASVLSVSSRILSASGDQAFFETSEALVPADTNGQGGCPIIGEGGQTYPACDDVYEWEAAGAGGCNEAAPAYSPINNGCVYLISTGKSKFPSLFADASADGKDVFFFTRDQLVGQDKDQLQDVYDAKAGGGLASQSPVAPLPCESAEACHGPAQVPPAESTPATQTFVGPGNQAQKHKKQKAKKKSKKHKKQHSKKKANAKGRTSR